MNAPRPRPWPLVVRRAREADRDAVMAFATRTWDGWDYIPRAWPHWLTAPDGALLVATAGSSTGGGTAVDADGAKIPADHPIAVARVALLSATEGWLEGIRVDPRVRGLGVATDFQVAELRWAAASGAQVVRYATGERNEASHRLGSRHGFELLAEFRLWQWHARPPSDEGDDDDEGVSGFDDEARAEANRLRASILDQMGAQGRACRPEDGDGWWQRLVGDPTFEEAQRLCEHRGWTMQQLTRAMFDRHVARGEVLTAGADGGEGWALAILHREALPAEDADVKFGVVAGHADQFARLAHSVRQVAGRATSFWLPHPDPPLLDGRPETLNELGFWARPWSLHILARPLDADHPPPAPDDPGGLILEDTPAPLRPLTAAA